MDKEITEAQEETLYNEWDYCDMEGKEMEETIERMSDFSGLSYFEVSEWMKTANLQENRRNE